MSDPTFTTPPAAPIRGDASTFSARFAAFLTWMATFVAEMIAAVPWFSAKASAVATAASDIAAQATVAADPAGYVGKCNDALSVSAGNKDISLTAARANLLTANRAVVLVLDSDPTIRMFGTIAGSPAPTSTMARVVVTSGGVSGSGTFSGWKVMDAAFFAAAATSAEIWAGTSDAAAITPKAMKDANAAQVLTPGSTVTPNLNNGRRFTLAPSASFTLGAPTNARPGDVIEFDVTNAAGSVVLAVNAAWKRQGGLGIIGPNNGDRSLIVGLVQEVDGSGNMTRGIYNVVRTPT